jgi:hypothetical protein
VTPDERRLVWNRGFVLAIGFFDRRLLIKRASRETIFIISLALFAAAIVVPTFKLGEPVLFPSLMNPLVSLGLVLLLRKLFVRRKQREPIDTFMNWRRGLAADRWFNIAYFSLGTLLMGLLWMGARLTGYKWY